MPAGVTGINVDMTAPTVRYSGNARSYTVDQTVSITCEATDALSGVATTTCQNISGAAHSFAIGANTFSATATDKASNTGSGATRFTVEVTAESMGVLIRKFVTNPDVANSLAKKAEDIATAPNA